MRVILPLICLVFASFTVTANDFIKDTIVDLEQACHMGEHDLDMIDSLLNQETTIDEILPAQKREIAMMLDKLTVCKKRLVTSLLETDACVASDVVESAEPSMLGRISTACDWVIRIASLLSALKVFYGYL